MKNAGKTAAIAVAAAMMLSACDGGTIHKTSKLGDLDVLSIDARQRLVLRGKDHNGDEVVCAEPSPDAIVAQAAVLAASGSGSGPAASGASAASGSGGFATGYSEGVGSIAMRTPMIQLMRDGYYRYCEALLNGVVDSEDYAVSLRLVDMFLVTIMAIEVLGGAVTVPPVTVNAGFSTKVNSEGGIDAGGTGGGQPLTINITKQPTDKANADAIREIVHQYLSAKRDIMLSMSKKKAR